MSRKENIQENLKNFKEGFNQLFKDLKSKKTFYKQIPNLLTLSRIGIACFIPFLALSSNLIGASILTIMAALTDAFDGLAARKLNAQSEFGRNLDPICDKLFVAILVVPLMLKLSPLLSLGLGANILLEAGIAGVNLNSKIKGNMPKTTWTGKIKTTLLSILLASLYVSFSYPVIQTIIPLIYSITTLSQVVTCIDYYRIDKKKDREKQTQGSQVKIEPKEESFDTSGKQIDSLNYTKEDLLKLREEIEAIQHSKVTKPEEPISKIEPENGFQKTLK